MSYPVFQVKNLTGHEIFDIMTNVNYPAEKRMVCRCNYTKAKMGLTEDGSVIYEAKYWDIAGLPEPKDGVKYLVSAKVLNAALSKGRTDCISPNDVVRNEQGQVVGCKGFRTNG